MSSMFQPAAVAPEPCTKAVQGGGYVWDPAAYFPPLPSRSASQPRYAAITLNNPIMDKELYFHVCHDASLRVAADGGANRFYDDGQPGYLEHQYAPHVITGDLDSIRPEVRARCEQAFDTVVVEDRDQYSTDFAKALRAVHRDPRVFAAVLVFGGLDGRADQAFAQLHELYAAAAEPSFAIWEEPSLAIQETPSADGRGGAPADGTLAGECDPEFPEVHVVKRPDVYLVAGDNVVFVLHEGRNVIRTRRSEGSVLGRGAGIIPLGRPAVISTEGFAYDVTDWPTSFGTQVSTSNYLVEDNVVVTTDQRVLFCIDLEKKQFQ